MKPLQEPPVPSLPKERARALTPTPSSPSSPSTSSFSSSTLFHRIPAEIRRRILIYAFGDRTLHFDLRLLPPLNKRKQRLEQERRGRRRGRRGPRPRPRHAKLPRSSERDWRLARRWEWCGSVCHRAGTRYWMHWTLKPARHEGSELGDQCHYGDNSFCHAWTGGPPPPGNCLIGAMGWLLTCRQAYVEGVEVLYSTNRLFIEGVDMMRRLPDLMLPQRRETIRSVKLLWNIHPWVEHPRVTRGEVYPKDSDMNGVVSLFKAMPSILPNLRYMFLSLQGDLRVRDRPDPSGPRDHLDEGEDEMILNASETLLRLVDETVRNLRQLSDCRVAVPSSYFRARNVKERGEGISTVGGVDRAKPLWRDIGEQVGSPGDEVGRSARRGYWICQGQHDWHHTHDYVP